MSLRPLLLSVSLAANTILLATFALQPARLPVTVRDFFGFSTESTSDRDATAASKAHSATKPAISPVKLWSTLNPDDLPTLVSRLRTAGFPVHAIRAILQALLDERYSARLRTFTQSDPAPPFWQTNSSSNSDVRNLAQYIRSVGERKKIMRELLGDFASRDDGDIATVQPSRYGTLSQAKIDQLDRISQDYREVEGDVRIAMNGITLPEDSEKLALLEREKRADIVALLSPEELANYDIHSSPLTSRLRPALTLFGATEAEYRAIYQIQQSFDTQINSTGPASMTVDERMTLRTAAQTAQGAQLRAALGDARYADFVRANDRDYQQFVRIEQGQNLPIGTAVQAYDLRRALSQESNRIVNDTALGYDQQLAALRSLAQNARAQLLATLGPAAGRAYVSEANWLSVVEHGAAVTFTANETNIRVLPNPNAPAPTK